ncbi:unnamed protein product, partial [Echinostoma caproni]|uniref:Endo/exonuclease/phosphatase domain-containing protein n=1 Tax=Echinostoma caproni TaxID=27848 RepID=A0A183BEX9_9TREM
MRSPSSRPEDDRALLNLIAAVSRGNHSPIIVGDSNLPAIEWEYEDEGDGQAERKFMDCFHAASLYQHVKEPSRIRLGQRPSTSDLVLTRQESEINDLRQEVPLVKSDHNVLLLEAYIAKEKPPRRWCRNLGRMNIADLRRDAQTRAWFPQGTEASVDQRWEKIRDQLIELTKRHAPLQPRGGTHKPQWWKPAIKRARGERAHYEKCETLKGYFENVYKIDYGSAVPRKCLDTPPMGDVEVSASCALKVSENLNVKKSACNDGLHPAVIRPLAQLLAPAIAALYQESLRAGRVPSDW